MQSKMKALQNSILALGNALDECTSYACKVHLDGLSDNIIDMARDIKFCRYERAYGAIEAEKNYLSEMVFEDDDYLTADEYIAMLHKLNALKSAYAACGEDFSDCIRRANIDGLYSVADTIESIFADYCALTYETAFEEIADAFDGE